MSEQEEKLPISEVIKVLKYETISKSGNWWSAVVKGEMFGKVKTFLYLWHMEKGAWKRKQKFTVPSPDSWNKIDEVVRRLIK